MTDIRARLRRLERTQASAPPSITIDRGDHPDQPPAGAVVLRLPRKLASAEKWVLAWQHLADC